MAADGWGSKLLLVKVLVGNVGARDLCCWARYLNNVLKRNRDGQNQRDALGWLYSQHANPDTWRQRAPPIPFYKTQKICLYFRKKYSKNNWATPHLGSAGCSTPIKGQQVEQ